MKKLILLSSLLFIMLSASAQNKLPEIDPARKPYITVNGFATDLTAMIFNRNKIKTVDVIKDSALLKRYGKRAQFGAVIIKTEPMNFMRINALLNRFRIVDSLKTLPVMIDDVRIADKNLILADETEVADIKAVNKNGEMILQIRTKKK